MGIGGQIKEKSKASGLSNWVNFGAFYWDAEDPEEKIGELRESPITRLVTFEMSFWPPSEDAE